MDGHLTVFLLETALDVVMHLLELHGVLSKFCAFENVSLIQQLIQYHPLMFFKLFYTGDYHLMKVVVFRPPLISLSMLTCLYIFVF
jgi:uncharacterized membrane protein